MFVTLLVIHAANSESLLTCNKLPIVGRGDCAGPWLFVVIYPIEGILKLASAVLAVIGIFVVLTKFQKLRRTKIG